MLNLQGHQDRHQSRLDGLRALSRAEADLLAVIRRAVAQLEPAPEPAPWRTLLQRLGLVEAPPVRVPIEEELWRHHEAALEQVRALGHHLEMFRHDQRQLQDDILQLSGASRELAHKRGTLQAKQSLARSQGRFDEDGQVAAELVDRATTEDRVHDLLAKHQTMQLALDGMLAVLSTLHAQGQQVTRDLGEQFAGLADQIAEQVGQDAIGKIIGSLGELALVVDSSAITLSRDLDSLSERLSKMDEDARQRIAARSEVERTLRR